MEIEADKIKNVLDRMLGNIEQENIDLYKKLVDEKLFKKIEDVEDFYLLLIYPFEQFVSGLIRTEISKNDEMDFLFIHYNYVESHFVKLFEEKEGRACSADKSRTIIRSLFNWMKTGKKIEWNYEQEYTYHLPKKIFKTHEDIIQFYEAIKHLYYGNPKKYLEALKNIMSIA